MLQIVPAIVRLDLQVDPFFEGEGVGEINGGLDEKLEVRGGLRDGCAGGAAWMDGALFEDGCPSGWFET